MLPGSDPVKPDDSEIPPASRATNQLCIISRDPLRAFIGALNPALRGCQELTIIVDRRWAGLENVAAPAAIERRQHPSVDAKVKTDGFAIVPLSTTENPKNPPWIERVVDHQTAGDDAEADERELQRILKFERRPEARIGPLVRVSAIVGAFSVLVVLLVALPTSERTPGPSIEPHSLSVVEAPAPPRPARLPAERIVRPRDTGRVRNEVVSPPPNPRSNTSPQSKRQPTNAEPAPPRPLIVASPEPTSPPATAPKPMRPTQNDSLSPRTWHSSPSASAPDPTRSSEGNPARTAYTAPTPGEVTGSPNSAPRRPSARGLEAWMQALESRVTRDVDTAGAEAKRQIDELKSNTMRSLAEMRRVWNSATRAFSDTDADQVQREAAAKPRR